MGSHKLKPIYRQRRWISRDPSGEGNGINLYDYVNNRPILAIDFLGLCDCKAEGAERDQIITEAAAFNKHTVWSWVNQCAEQASALINDLLSKGLGKYWTFQTVAGSTQPVHQVFGVNFGYGIQEHAVEARPHKAPCCHYGPFIMDPYHGPGTNDDRNVLIETPDQFNEEYPNSID